MLKDAFENKMIVGEQSYREQMQNLTEQITLKKPSDLIVDTHLLKYDERELYTSHGNGD